MTQHEQNPKEGDLPRSVIWVHNDYQPVFDQLKGLALQLVTFTDKLEGYNTQCIYIHVHVGYIQHIFTFVVDIKIIQ